ncbi:hypothetical protein F2Q70_00004976 [Brassica cretica]|uniref:Uncharacterized protein n=1 Tax=Brassica cretica TaxID=69181 RepID=A0A8S9IZU9_BRACR|nr:hypothetical protein F2Q70_00004976 [Brassica cretica]
MTSSSGSLKLEIYTEDKTPGKWSVPLSEEVFRRFLSGAGGSEKAVFSEGSIFSPFLFGKYFDPSDAFPLWEFEADVLLANLRSVGQCRVDWSQIDQTYVLISDLPVVGKNNVQVYVDVKGQMMEISGQWNINKNGGQRRLEKRPVVGIRLRPPSRASRRCRPPKLRSFPFQQRRLLFLRDHNPKINSKNKF